METINLVVVVNNALEEIEDKTKVHTKKTQQKK